SSDTNNPISRVIAPGGPGFDQPAKAGDPAAATAGAGNPPADAPPASDADAGSISPKKVRTVLVRPDMTVISSQASAAGEAGKAPAAPAASANPAPDVPPKTTQMDAVVDSG